MLPKYLLSWFSAKMQSIPKSDAAEGQIAKAGKFSPLFYFPLAYKLIVMNRVLVKFHQSTIPEDEKQRRLWEAMGLLLRTSKKKCKKSKGKGP